MSTEGAADLAPFLAHLRAHGVRFDVAAPLRRDPDAHGHPHASRHGDGTVHVPGLPPIAERRRGRVGSDHATWSVAVAIAAGPLVRPGDTVWEIGTGSGVLAVAAHHLGARRIVATDVDAGALEIAAGNLRAAGARAALHAGSLLDAIPADEPPPAVVIANLPHKPRREGDVLPLAEDGGPEGYTLLAAFARQAGRRLPRGARLVFFQHSLPHPRNLALLAEAFDLRLLSWKRRLLAPGEYGALQEWFVERSRAGTSYVAGREPEDRYLIACVWLASRR